MFRSTDPNEAWTGSRNNSGEVLPTGVYVYRIRYEVERFQTQREHIGHVTLLK